MEVTEPVSVPDGVTVLGAKAGIAASSGARANTDVTDETVFSQPITIGDNAKIDGVVLKARPIFAKATAATVINSKIFGVDVSGATDNSQKAVINMEQWKKPIELHVTGNYFGDNTGVYNVFELNAPLADGSEISNNYFTEAVGSHNVINIYAMENDAVVNIKNNYFEKSASAARIGTKGEVRRSIINFVDNTYKTTDVPEWAGLVTIQPYGKATKSMGGLTININNTNNQTTEPQLYVYFATQNDADLDEVNKPIVKINGVRENWNVHPNGNIILG